MSIQTVCPLGAIGAISDNDCSGRLPQIVRLKFGKVDGVSYADETDGVGGILEGAAVAANLAASDDTKVQLAPINENFVIPSAEIVKDGGGDNTTAFGQSVPVGFGNITATGRWRDLKPEVAQELRESYNSQGAVFGNLGAYLIDEFGFIYGKQPAGAGNPVLPIPFNNFVITSDGSEGYNTSTFTPFEIELPIDWREDLVVVKPTTFDYRTIKNDFAG